MPTGLKELAALSVVSPTGFDQILQTLDFCQSSIQEIKYERYIRLRTDPPPQSSRHNEDHTFSIYDTYLPTNLNIPPPPKPTQTNPIIRLHHLPIQPSALPLPIKAIGLHLPLPRIIHQTKTIMSLVLLAHACSHLQNASLARLGLTSLPSTTQLHTLLLQLQKSGYVNTVVTGGPIPPPPSALAPIMSANPEARREGSGHVASMWGDKEQEVEVGMDKEKGDGEEGVTQGNISSRRLWVGLKYYNSRPVLESMRLVSKPTRRVWMPVGDLEGLLRGEKRGYVGGLRGVGEAMFVTTDRGIMEIRECVERRIGGMLLCRINGVEF